MKPRLLMLALTASVSFAEAADVALPAGTRIRLQTDAPPWTEGKGAREVPGPILRQDAESLTFQPLAGGEPVTGTKRGQWLIGELVSSDPEYLSVKLPRSGELLRVPARLVSRVEVSKGGSRGRSAGIGLLIGASVMGLVAGASYQPSVIMSRSNATMVAAVGGGALGALLGAGTGGEGWEPVGGKAVRIDITPKPRGAGGQITIGF